MNLSVAEKAHFEGLRQELRTGSIHTACRVCSPTCSRCGVSTEGAWYDLRQAGWAFDVDGRDFCPSDNPYTQTPEPIDPGPVEF